ncbi:hypothetical protein GCM10009560_78900 [Nonomuraea longicatena]|uniref:Uncharacterized protein n=2 Tax=Nonomuraea longicatena TaxID=83682 RepID=A0ABP4BVA0_9ACTN
MAAIRENIEANDSMDPARLARQIERDIIKPAVADIHQRMATAKARAAKKSWLSIGVGVVAMTVGHFANIPLLLPAGIAASLR